ncbi:DedA family protein [Aneurinibacillus tyrosinisolvens]|uniref:DedA family protein n=1 Tax=Aneurinibacillus tyrosinisolvens TaxID=1443435 RepID=UPI00063F2AC2|nr:DedA family protein [Aneurinibacillus tyrosinisolvens]
MEHQLHSLLTHYGYFGIILALIGGIVGLPLPDEILLTYVGYLVYHGDMSYPLALLSAAVGALAGITVSYFLGHLLGLAFLKKIGPWLHISEEKIERTQKLFNKFGPFLLFIGYFIPGVRHITAYLAGISRFNYHKFALYAYSGGIVWILVFITIGKTLGQEWRRMEMYIHQYSFPLIAAGLLILAFVFIYTRKRTV